MKMKIKTHACKQVLRVVSQPLYNTTNYNRSITKSFYDTMVHRSYLRSPYTQTGTLTYMGRQWAHFHITNE